MCQTHTDYGLRIWNSPTLVGGGDRAVQHERRKNEHANILRNADTGRCRQIHCRGAPDAQPIHLPISESRRRKAARTVLAKERQTSGRVITNQPAAVRTYECHAAGPEQTRNNRRGGSHSANRNERRNEMTLQSIIPADPIHGFLDAIQRLRANLAEQRKAQAAYDRTFNELSAMSNRDLADIGVDRAAIPLIAAEAASAR